MTPPLPRRLLAEFLGSAFLAALVIGSGIAAARLSDDPGLRLLENAAATAAGAVADRPVRARAKITSTSPQVATSSANRCAGLARWWLEMLIAVRANMPLAAIAPTMQPAICAGM